MTLDQQLLAKAEDGDMAACAELIKSGANIDAIDVTGWASIHYAAYFGYIELAKLLLENGAQTNVKDKEGWTPLHSAVYRERIDLSELLLSYGAGIEEQEEYGRSPLIFAMNYGMTRACLYLLDRGANASGVHAMLSDAGIQDEHPDCVAAVTSWMAGRSARDALAQGVKAPSRVYS